MIIKEAKKMDEFENFSVETLNKILKKSELSQSETENVKALSIDYILKSAKPLNEKVEIAKNRGFLEELRNKDKKFKHKTKESYESTVGRVSLNLWNSSLWKIQVRAIILFLK